MNSVLRGVPQKFPITEGRLVLLATGATGKTHWLGFEYKTQPPAERIFALQGQDRIAQGARSTATLG